MVDENEVSLKIEIKYGEKSYKLGQKIFIFNKFLLLRIS